MNIEEARRAALRREEDLEWLRITQQCDRDRGDVIRRQQREVQQARQDQQRELRNCEYEYQLSKSYENREAEIEEDVRRSQERERNMARDRVSILRRQKAAAIAARRKRQEDAIIAELELEHEQKIAAKKEAEKKRKLAVGAKYHKSRTPNPATNYTSPSSSPHVSERRSQSVTTATSPPKNNVPTEAELTQKLAEEKLRERQEREVKRLENILLMRQKKEDDFMERERQEREIEGMAKNKGTLMEEQELKARAHHFEHVDRNRRQQLLDKQKAQELAKASKGESLPPLQKVKSTDTETSRTADWFEEESSHQQMEQSIHRRRVANMRAEAERYRQLEEEARAKQDQRIEMEKQQKAKIDWIVRIKQKSCVDYQRAVHEHKMSEQQQRLEADMEMAKQFREKEIKEQEEFAVATKQREHDRVKWMEYKQERRREGIQLKAAHARMEVLQMREQIAAHAAEKKKLDTGLTEELAQNRRNAVEKMRLKELQVREEAEVLRMKEDQLRLQAREAEQAERVRRLEDKARRQEIRRRDAIRNRDKQKEEKEEQLRVAESFYLTKDNPKKGRVPSVRQKGKTEVFLPPHREMAAMEADTEAFLGGILHDLDQVDRRAAQLNHRV